MIFLTPSQSVIKIGDTAYVAVAANKRWNDSGIDLFPGYTYNFIVPQNEKWVDWHQWSGANGYESTRLFRVLEILRPAPDADWLQLIGQVGKSRGERLVIGSKLFGFSPSRPGRLYLFANTLPYMYWKNQGTIAARVTRIS